MSSTHEPFRGSLSPHTRQQLRARRFRRPGRDVYVLGSREDSLRLSAAAVLAALPDAVLSHATAAALLGLPAAPSPEVHVLRPPDAAVSRRSGVRTHRSALEPSELVLRAGLWMTSPTRTLVDLSPALSGEELVVLGDAVARRAGLPALRAAVSAAAGRRGVVRLRQALHRVDPGADSPAETRARLLLHGAGFLGLRHQVEVRDADGGWLARPDLADEEAQVAVQYDGLVHFERGPQRWRADIDRDELTRAAGWEVVVLTALDLRQPERAVAKVAGAYLRAAARRRGPRP